jgi:hypothetical protein
MTPLFSLRSRNRRSSNPKRRHRILRECRLVIEHLEDRNLLATGLGLLAGLTDSPSALLTTGFYYDLIGRAPAASEVSGWVSALQSGVSPYQEALAFTSSSEYQARLVTDDYWNLLKRGPSPAEVNGWIQALQSGVSEQLVEADFLSSPEYYQDHGSNPETWLTSLYQNVLDRTPSETELASWNQPLQNGASRGLVAMGFVDSPEAHSLEVASAYARLLGRNPDPAGLAGWVAAMSQGLTPSLLRADIAASSEYAADQTLTPEAPATFNTGSNAGLYFEFASNNSLAAAGYTKVPVVNYTPTRGYGWLDITGIGWRDRSSTNPLTSNLETATDGTFLVDLPNGAYTVTVSLGDAEELHDNVSLWANGTLLASGLTMAAGQFSQPSYSVQATNGQLAFRIASQGSVNPAFAIDALVISPVIPNKLAVNPTILESATANSAYSTTVSGTGGSGNYTFAATSGSLPSWLSLNPSTGVLSGTPTTSGTSTFTITATDNSTAGLTGSQTYTLTVNPASSLTLSPTTLPSGTVSSFYSTPLSATGGSGSYTFAITSGSLPSWLSLNMASGLLNGLPTTSGVSTFTITATDSRTAALLGSQTYTLRVNSPGSLTLSPATLPSATANGAYSTTLGATGGSGTYTFAATSGSLPSWLLLNPSTGLLSGTPTTSGTSTFTITATDSRTAGLIGSQPYTLTVNPASSLRLSPAALASAMVSSAYSTTLSATGGSGTYTFTATSGSLPLWLSLNASTGVLSGMPTAAGTATFTITASDSQTAALFGSQTYTLTVNPAGSLTLGPATLPSATANGAYSTTLSATGGSGTYTFAASPGSLPAWLSLNTTTGVLSGTPTTSSTSTFTITATDSKTAGLSGSQTYTLTVNPASSLTLSPTTLPSATVNSTYSTTLSATGGSGTYTFAVTSGSLPSWLSLNTITGVLSGTPTTSATSTFTITASDSSTAGRTGSQTYTLTVNPANTLAFPNNVNVPPLPPPTGTIINVSNVFQLQDAVNNLQSGQTVMIAPGFYDLTGTHPLIVPQGLTNISIRGATGKASDVVIQGDAVFDTSPPYTGSAIWGPGSGITGTIPYGIYLANVQGVTIADLTLRDYVIDAIIMNAGVQSPLIHDVVMIDVGEQFIKVNPNPAGGGVNNGIVEYSTMEFTNGAPNNYTNGVDLITAQNWIIRNNLFKNIHTTNTLATTGNPVALTGPAVLVWVGSGNVQTINNTFINCQTEIAYGLISGSTFDNTGGLIANNFIYRDGNQHGDVGISVRNSPNTEVAYNTIIINGEYPNAIEYRFTTTTGVKILYNLTDAAITQRDGASASITGNVTAVQSTWFVDESMGNLNLTSAGMAALDHGVFLPEVPLDYNDQQRPSAGPTDIGAA